MRLHKLACPAIGENSDGIMRNHAMHSGEQKHVSKRLPRLEGGELALALAQAANHITWGFPVSLEGLMCRL